MRIASRRWLRHSEISAVERHSDRNMRVAVTGARGYLGRRTVRTLQRMGHEPILLSRHPATGDITPHLYFDLTETNPTSSDFAHYGTEALIHCAWDFRPRDALRMRQVNVEGSWRLFDFATRGGVRKIVNISTMSAFCGCRSDYGKSKLLVEREVSARGGTSLRSGLIWGQLPRGDGWHA